DHQLAGALGHEQEAVKVAEAALPLRPPGQAQELLLAAGFGEPAEARIKELRLAEGIDRRDAQLAVAAVGAVADQGAVGEAQRRNDGDAGDGFALVFEAHERGPDRDAADEAAGAVDRVDDPAVAGLAGGVARLFAEEAVGGKGAE